MARKGKRAVPNRQYTEEFRGEAVKLVIEKKQAIAEVARRLDMSEQTLAYWVGKSRRGEPLRAARPVSGLSELEAELVRLRQENARLREEKEILRKATAYFVKESR